MLLEGEIKLMSAELEVALREIEKAEKKVEHYQEVLDKWLSSYHNIVEATMPDYHDWVYCYWDINISKDTIWFFENNSWYYCIAGSEATEETLLAKSVIEDEIRSTRLVPVCELKDLERE